MEGEEGGRHVPSDSGWRHQDADRQVVGLAADDELFDHVVLDEVAGDRHLAIEIGQAEAFSLAARPGGITWPRPMTYQIVAALMQALGGRVGQVRIDRLLEEPHVATVEVDGPPGAGGRCAGDSPTAARLRRALAAPPITTEKLGT